VSRVGEMLDEIIRDAEAGLAVGWKTGCPDCDARSGFHLVAAAPKIEPPRPKAKRPDRKTVRRPTRVTARPLGSPGPLPAPPPLTLGPDGIWRSREPVEAR